MSTYVRTRFLHLLSKALHLAQAGDWPAAMAAFRRAADLDASFPDDLELHDDSET